jgi:thiol:disulfide interchange protein DsbA
VNIHVYKIITRLLIGWLFAAFTSWVIASEAPTSAKFTPKEGVDAEYELLKTPMPVRDPKKIEVVEFFWYGCPHCYALESRLEEWLKKLPKDVDFWRSPAVFGPTWKIHAQVFYTEEALGILPKTHRPFFDAVHEEEEKQQGNHDVFNTLETITAEFVKLGVPADKFAATFNSFIVLSKVNQADQRGRDYKLESVPTIIVNGKYMVHGGPHTFETIDYLVNKERIAL